MVVIQGELGLRTLLPSGLWVGGGLGQRRAAGFLNEVATVNSAGGPAGEQRGAGGPSWRKGRAEAEGRACNEARSRTELSAGMGLLLAYKG